MRLLIAVALLLVGVAGHAWGQDAAKTEHVSAVETASASALVAQEMLTAHVLGAGPTATAVHEEASRTAVDNFLNDGWTIGNCRITADRSITRTDRRQNGAPAPLDRCRILPNGGLYVADWRDTPTPSPTATKVP